MARHELTDAQFAVIAPLLPAGTRRGRPMTIVASSMVSCGSSIPACPGAIFPIAMGHGKPCMTALCSGDAMTPGNASSPRST